MPISDSEAERIKGQVAEGVDRPKSSITFEIGETVRVADGPFASFNGIVEDVDEDRSGSRSRFRSSAARRRWNWNMGRLKKSENGWFRRPAGRGAGLPEILTFFRELL